MYKQLTKKYFIYSQKELDRFDCYNGSSTSYYYGFGFYGELFILGNIEIPEGYGLYVNKIIVSSDIKFKYNDTYNRHIPLKIKVLNRKQIIAIKEGYEKFTNVVRICSRCGAEVGIYDIVTKNGNFYHDKRTRYGLSLDCYGKVKEVSTKPLFVWYRPSGRCGSYWKHRVYLDKQGHLQREQLMEYCGR